MKRIKDYLSLFGFRDRRLLEKSSLFDAKWYAEVYPDVVQAGLNPTDHYLRTGYRENRIPSLDFDPVYYLKANPDVAAAGINPLVHYLRFGEKEGRPSEASRFGSPSLVSQSGLFDEGWYAAKYPDVRDSGMKPIHHYLQHGALANRAPGPLFDSIDYRTRHRDVAASGKDPLSHFVEFGARENRYAQSGLYEPAVDRWGEVASVPLLHQPLVQPRIAVAVHVFYVELFEEICTYLHNIPYHFNLLITTPNENNEPKIRAIAGRHRLNATVYVKISKNRGRNFGPLLVEYSELLLQHDLFLHLHTKKSLHSGSDASAWRSHLYHSLLANCYLVSAIIDRLVNTRTGVLYPATYPGLPYWAHHWLSNSHLIESFYRRIAVPYSKPLSYLDYPVGSMFWASPEALRPLLEVKWTYDDFPPEQGQNDGTLAHVIERSIVIIVKSQNYGFIEFDYQAGSFRYNWSRKNLHQYAERTAEDLKTRIKHSDIVSFDIFDTLLTRAVLTPDALLRYAGWLLAHRAPELKDFYEVRKRSEDLARKQKSEQADVDLDEIYGMFQAAGDWDEEDIALARQVEIDLESRSFCVRADIIEALRYARSLGKRTIAVSDTYFSRSFVEGLLSSLGVVEMFDEVYLSSERGRRKDRGDMWDYLLSAEQLGSRRMLHIGDNEHSDAQLAGDRRIETFHVMSPVTLMVHSGIPIAADRSWTTDVALGGIAARFFNSPFLSRRSFRPFTLSEPREFGFFIFGPLLFAFFSWLFTHPVLKSLDHLYFLSREGYFLHKLFEKLHDLPGISVPPTSYFYISRRAAISAAQALKFDPSEITFGFGFRGTISELLNIRIGLQLPHDVVLGAMNIVLPDDSAYVESVLKTLEPYIVEHGRLEMNALRQYCEENGMMDQARIGLLDVGYSGSIQNALQTVLGKGLTGFYMATVEDVTRVEHANGISFGCFADRESFATTRSIALKHSRILEAFLTAPHGQVLRFEIQDERAVPCFKAEGYSQSAFSALTDIYEGVTDYFCGLLQAFGPEVLLIAPDLKDSQLPLRALVEHDIVVSSKIGDALYVEDEYCGQAELTARHLAISSIEECLQCQAE